MLVRYDPEANAATLRFEESGHGGGLSHQILTSDGHLRGLIRVSGRSEFEHLELLSATSAIPQVLAELEPARDGVRDFQRGTIDVLVSAQGDNGPVQLIFTEDVACALTVNVSSVRSGDVLAEVRLLPDGRLVDVTFYPVGHFLAGVLNQIHDRGRLPCLQPSPSRRQHRMSWPDDPLPGDAPVPADQARCGLAGRRPLICMSDHPAPADH